jgi:hypothetical protein
MLQLRLLATGFPSRRPGLDDRSGHVVFEVENVVLRWVFSQHFGFPCQFSYQQTLRAHQSSAGGIVAPEVATRTANWAQSHPTHAAA